MAMNYNDIHAPGFVDFDTDDVDQNLEGDSWFSNDSKDFEQDDLDLSENADDSILKPTISFEPVKVNFASTVKLGESASTSGTPVQAPPAPSSSSTSTASTSSVRSGLVTREEFERNRKQTTKVTTFAATPPQRRANNALERKNSRRRSIRKGAPLTTTRMARKAAQRARDRLTPKKPAETKAAGVTLVEPFRLATESLAKKRKVVEEPVGGSLSSNPGPTKIVARPGVSGVPGVASKHTAASSASRNVFKSDAEILLKFSTKTPDRFRTRKFVSSTAAPKADEDAKVPRTILDPRLLKEKGKLPQAKKKATTCPKSPAFALKNRKRRIVTDETEEVPVSKPTVKPSGMSKLKSALRSSNKPEVEKKVTIPQPFECYTRSEEMLEHKNKEIEKVLEDERAKREFHAQPLPDLDKVSVPEKKQIPPTAPKPFNLMTDERGIGKEQEWENHLKEEEQQKRKAASFKAQPAKVLDNAPFVPKPPRKPLTEFQEFNLATTERAEQWEENEAKRAERDAQIRAEEEERQRQFKIAEDEAIKKMRDDMVHKAKPVPNYKPMVLRGSDKPLTVPQSPEWSYTHSKDGAPK